MKRIKLISFLVFIACAFCPFAGYSQKPEVKGESTRAILDSLAKRGIYARSAEPKPEIVFSADEALKYLQHKYRFGNWSSANDPLRLSLGQLVYFASHQPYDSTVRFLSEYPFDSINIPWENFYRWDSLKLRIPVVLHRKYSQPPDSMARADTFAVKFQRDSLGFILPDWRRDSIDMYRPQATESTVIMKDTVFMIITDTLPEVSAHGRTQPFRSYSYPFQVDSVNAAINSLIGFVNERDSSLIQFRGVSGSSLPVWLNSRSDRMVRYWLKNEFFDSVTVWVGSVDRNTIGLYLEEGIMFRRPVKQTNISDAQLNIKEVDAARLQDVNKIYVKPRYWKLRTESAFVLSQTFLTNWVKGGESSVTTVLDLTGFADYINKDKKILSNNFIRLKYGLIKTGDNPIQKNLDLLETNSKLNHKAFGKFDFSATLLFKTQTAPGYNYPNDSVMVSKFMNPATVTVGLGLDYKPHKSTSINFAPLSYKATHVFDTAHIDQTKYGVPKNKRSMHEPGISLMVSNEFKPWKSVTVINRLQLFTNYINKPQNIDVDWEVIASAKLNWFTEVRLNTHLIFDDDTKTVVLDEENKPVTGPDGKPKQTARIQFKELLGFSFVFRF